VPKALAGNLSEAQANFYRVNGSWGQYQADRDGGRISFEPLAGRSPNQTGTRFSRSFAIAPVPDDQDRLTITSQPGRVIPIVCATIPAMYLPGIRRRVRCTVRALVVMSTAATVLAVSPVAAQGDARARPRFDISRFVSGLHGTFDTFKVSRTRAVREALARKDVALDTDVLVTDTPDGPLALLTEQMAYHHIAQGGTRGGDWLVTFCVVCNTAARLTPIVQGKRTTFETVGVYDGLMVMQDAATGTLWHHMTGEAIFGPEVGASLGPPGNVLHLTVQQLLARAPDARIAISNRYYFAGGRRHGSVEGISLLNRVHTRANNSARLSNGFAATLGAEDKRRPRMDLGLGIWSATSSRYYPRDRIHEEGDVLIDRMDGQTVLVYLDPVTSTPAALFINATHAQMDDEVVRLDDGSTVRDSVLYNSHGQQVEANRPLQVFTRWYGFALTFPGTSVFGDSGE